METKLKVYVTTSLPQICYDNQNLFFKILNMLDGLNISVHHYNEDVADEIRGCISQFPRQSFYVNLPQKEKIRLNLNIVKGKLDTKGEINRCLQRYDWLGFNSFKFSEIQHSTEDYVSFEKIYGFKLPSPYFGGCQTLLNTKKYLGIDIKTPLLLKRSCWACEETLKASFMDGVKVIYKMLKKQPLIDNSHYGIIYEDGRIASGWLKQKGETYVDKTDKKVMVEL
jgi:hypothetical protein